MQEEIFLMYLLWACEEYEGEELKKAIQKAVEDYKLGKGQ